MGFEKLLGLFHHAYNRGITFFDLADLYGTHVYFREALRTLPREKVTILTKLWSPYDKEVQAKGKSDVIKEVAKATVQRFCHELSTDYIDILLLHCMRATEWPDDLAPYMEALNEAKKKKQVRAVGVSCHHLGALKTAATHPWVDVILARINPHGVKMDGTTEEVVSVLKTAKENGKAIIGMKIFGEGQLVEKKQECIRFAQELGLLDTMTIGFEKTEYIDETLSLMDKYPAAKVG
jgi:aryl-alcohol dehydrogenase-like predicted oxidoreductase